MKDRATKKRIEGLYALAKRCGVSFTQACSRIGMSPSTPYRWLNAALTPNEKQLVDLRTSILILANEAGAVPADLADEVAQLLAAADNPASAQAQAGRMIETIERNLADLKKIIL